jgi:DNA (cytosine-5)-methyltransferase 1
MRVYGQRNKSMISFGSVCSGIEAASVAWHPLGWKAAWLSEIEKFPCALLAHHYPDVPNLGDMTTLPDRIRSGEVEAPDVFCGGTPCQAFSVAGLRKSLDDARGNLSLTFCEIADAIDQVRLIQQSHPSIVFWENVPGVLNTKDNAFGCFLGALAGEDDALIPPGGRWSNAGFIDGPQRAVAWRVLDAQYFGVAQRRRRVFIIASARDDFDPAAVLFEFEGLRRNTAPSREKRQGVAPSFRAGSPDGKDTIGTLMARDYKGIGNQDLKDGRGLVLNPIALAENTIGRQPQNGGNATEPMHDIAPCLTKADQHGVAQPIPFDTTQITSPQNGNNPKSGDPCHPLAAGAHPPAIAQPTIVHGTQDPCVSDIAFAQGRNNGGENVLMQAIGWSEELNALEGVQPTIQRGGQGGRHEGVMTQSMAVRRLTPVECERLQGFPDNYTKIADKTPDGPRYKALGNSWAVPVVRWIGERIARAT